MVLAPVPITATCFPSSSTSWFQRAVWKIGPSKRSAPSIRERAGRLSWPQAETRTSASSVSPPFVSIRQRPDRSSNCARVTSVPSRRFGAMPYFSTQRSR